MKKYYFGLLATVAICVAALFAACSSLKAIDGIENWDLSSAENMESMFESCMSLEDISFLSNWDMSNVENIFEMFRDCYSLRDASCLNWKFKKLNNLWKSILENVDNYRVTVIRYVSKLNHCFALSVFFAFVFDLTRSLRASSSSSRLNGYLDCPGMNL